MEISFAIRGQLTIFWNTARGSQIFQTLFGRPKYLATDEIDRLLIGSLANEIGNGQYLGQILRGNDIISQLLNRFSSIDQLITFLENSADILANGDYRRYRGITQVDGLVRLTVFTDVANFVGTNRLRADGFNDAQEYLDHAASCGA